MSSLSVLKFGSSVLRTPDDLARAVQEIVREWRAGRRVVAVVSAIGNTTDELMRSAGGLGEGVAHLPALLATGEARAAALMGLACERAGLLSVVAEPARLGLVAEGADPLDHTPVAVDVELLRSFLKTAAVVIVPGFTGIDRVGRTVLFGRGGSDLTALFLAARLGAHCRLLKDVDGVFEQDPAAGRAVQRFERVDWSTLIAVGGALVQSKAVTFARDEGLAFEVGALGSPCPTRVGGESARLKPARPEGEPIAVALCGLGTVGGGVAQLLLQQPDRYRIVGALVRDPAKHRDAGLSLTTDLADLFSRGPRVLLELTGGGSLAQVATERALELGIDVVSADKALIAAQGAALERRCGRSGAKLLYSAAVGGVVPMIETVQLLAEGGIRSFAGVLNGTVQYVLQATSDGLDLSTAVALAQNAGYAEADPRADLEGDDTRRKLVLLARLAFGNAPEVEGLGVLDEGVVERARASKGALRLVARGERRDDDRVQLSVNWEEHGADSFFAGLTGNRNGLEVIDVDGVVHRVSGSGAGRWPTATAVLADLEDLHARVRTRIGGAS